MGLSTGLIVFPLVILAICVLISGGGGLTYGGNTQPFCSATNGLACVQGAGGTTYTCSTTSDDCILPYDCPGTLPAGTYCTTVGGSFIGAHPTVWMLTAGSALYISDSASSNLGPPATQVSNPLIFGAISATGFIILISTATAVIVLASINFLGSGENTEGVHIAFMTALLLGLWLIMSGAEGFLTGSPNSYFAGLNNWVSGIGSTFYVTLTLFFTLGIIGSVSRSSGSGGGV